MEVDDVDTKLMEAMRSLGTNDHESLITRFQQILCPDHNIDSTTASFFLDMNNWNLQQALCSFYDYGGATVTETELFDMTFVQDVTIGEGESVAPSTKFVKTWKVRNSGTSHWPLGCALRCIAGIALSSCDTVCAPTIGPGQETELSIELTSPAEYDIFQSKWRMVSPQGVPFGESVWCIINVEASGLLGLTQQLAGTTCMDIPSTSTAGIGTSSLFGGMSPLGIGGTMSPFSSPFKHHSEMHIKNVSPTSEVALLGLTPPHDSHLLNDSLCAEKGSPTTSTVNSASLYVDFDPPASPNGSTAVWNIAAQSFQNASGDVPGRINLDHFSHPPRIYDLQPESPPLVHDQSSDVIIIDDDAMQ